MRQSDRLILNVLSNYGVMAVQMIASLITLPVVVGHLGRDGFGLACLVLTVLGVVDLLAVSLGRTLQRFVPQAMAERDCGRFNRLFNTTFGGFFVLGATGAVTGWLIRDWLLQDVTVDSVLLADVDRAFWLLLLWLAIGFPANVYSRAVEALQRYDLVAVYSTIAAIVRSVGLIGLFVIGYGSITTFVSAQLLAEVIVLFGCRRALHLQVPTLVESPKWITRQDAAELSKFTAGALLFVIGNLCITQGFRLLVGKELGVRELGALAAVLTVTNLMWRLIYGMLSTLTPAVSAMQAADRGGDVQRIFVSGAKYAMAVSASFCLVPLPIITPLFVLWLGDEFRGLDALLIVAMLSQILITLGTTPQLILMGLGRVHVSGIIMLARGLLSLAAAWAFLVFVGRSLPGSLGCLTLVQAVGGYVLFLYTCNATGSSKAKASFDVMFWPLLLGVLGAGITWGVASQVGVVHWWSVMVSAACGELVFIGLLLSLGLNQDERFQIITFVSGIRRRLMGAPQPAAGT